MSRGTRMLRLVASASRSLAIAWVLALGLTALAVVCVGESPWLVFKVLGASAFGSGSDFSYTLFYATPMLLTGAAVTLALQAGLFNIGAEGQLYIGALAAAAWGAATRNWFAAGQASFLFLSFTFLTGAVVSFAGGALWGGIAGYLRTRRQTHEVIATIMLNFVALAAVNWAVLNPLKNPDTQNLETFPIAAELQLPRMWNQVTWGLPFALALAILVPLILRWTWWGFRVRASGANTTAAELAGIPVRDMAFKAMILSGGVAGLVGFHEVFLHAFKLIDSFSPGYGFTGLAIALLARGNPIALVLSALLFGALHKGALDLDLETERVTRDLSAVIQALILLSLAVQPAFEARLSRLRMRWRKKAVR